MRGWVPARRARALVVVALAAAAGGLAPSPARAAPGQSGTGSTIAHVNVTSSVLLTDLTPSFALVGIPGSPAAAANAVSMRVITNAISGYTVTVQPETATLNPSTIGDLLTIPISTLLVRETGTQLYVPLNPIVPVVIHSQPTESAAGGDLIKNDYSITMPWAAPGRYTATLDYLVTTL